METVHPKADMILMLGMFLLLSHGIHLVEPHCAAQKVCGWSTNTISSTIANQLFDIDQLQLIQPQNSSNSTVQP